MVGVEHHHLGRAPRLAARLDHAGARVGRLHERQRSRRGAARRKFLARSAQRRQVDAGARAAFEDHALVAVPAQDRIHAVLDLEDEACRALRFGLDADVEIDRAVERGVLVEQQVLELGVKGVAGVGVGEVTLLVAPSADGIDDARDQLADAALAPRRAERSAKIFRDDDVGRGLRPRSRNFNVLLLEDDAAVLARNDGAAEIPIDLRIRIDAGGGEESLEHDAASGRRGIDGRAVSGRGAVGYFGFGIHLKIYRSPAHHRILPASVTCALSPHLVSLAASSLRPSLPNNLELTSPPWATICAPPVRSVKPRPPTGSV